MSVIDPATSPEQAAQEVVLTVLSAIGPDLIKNKQADPESAERIGKFATLLHATLVAHFKKLGAD